MHTSLSKIHQGNQSANQAAEIIKQCVHCGLCNATCPTYDLLGSELDGPRGRIYLIKQFLEGEQSSAKTHLHLDRCLTCRACETTCPSNVEYGRLVNIGRELISTPDNIPVHLRLYRHLILAILPHPRRLRLLLFIARLFHLLLPRKLQDLIPPRVERFDLVVRKKARKVLLLKGCVQSVLSPQINKATTQILAHFGIESMQAEEQYCCGALNHHLGATKGSHRHMTRLLAIYKPLLAMSPEAIVSTASGCGSHLQEIGSFLSHPIADEISNLTCDISQIVLSEVERTGLVAKNNKMRVVVHAPCTLQHGLKINDHIERILSAFGFHPLQAPNHGTCCGSAGSYSLLHPKLSARLLENKLRDLLSLKPDLIVTANIGCLHHLQSKSSVRICHWVELVAQHLPVKKDYTDAI